MNRLNKFLMATVICISVGYVSCDKCIFPIKGNGHLVTLEKNVSAFEKINDLGSAKVRFHASEEYRAVVTVDENLDEYIEVFTKNNTLYIRPRIGHSCVFTKFIVDVYCPVLTGISISGSGSFEGIDKISASTLEIYVMGSGKVAGTVECDNLSVKISGSGKITVDGYSTDANIAISGSGRYNGNDFSIKNASVNISGSGHANIFVTDNLIAKISGSGNINYRGEPKIDYKISGSGRIRKL
jgi:hypothetical protein